jgi:hypothetical protein
MLISSEQKKEKAIGRKAHLDKLFREGFFEDWTSELRPGRMEAEAIETPGE